MKTLQNQNIARPLLAAVVAAVIGWAMPAGAEEIFSTDYPNADSIDPSLVTELQSLTGNTNKLAWHSGVADGIAGPTSGGTLQSSQRVGSEPIYAELLYKIQSSPDFTFSYIKAILTIHTYDVNHKVQVDSSTDGVTWENNVNLGSDRWGDTAVLTNDLSTVSAYELIDAVWFKISMPTFTTPGVNAVLDDFRVEATEVYPAGTTIVIQ